jgi:hypothetical protein
MLKGTVAMTNDYYIEDDIVYILLQERNGNRIVTKIDLEDLEKVSSFEGVWYFRKDVTHSYVIGSPKIINKVRPPQVRLHRFITHAVGRQSVVDHLNHDTLDNRKSNLEVTTVSRNAQNLLGAHKDSKTGVRNVHFNRHGNYEVRIGLNNKVINFGTYKDIETATKVAEEARKTVFK